MSLFERILQARGLNGQARELFLHPDYTMRHDPFLLPDMHAAVERLAVARKKQESVVIYGDYDIDGLSATAVLIDAFRSFGFERVDAFIPNRFVEGYGMTIEAVDKVAAMGADIIVTVDCGSLSEKEIVYAQEKGIDVIVTDHHNVAPVQPPAVAVINPKRLLQDYPERYKDYIRIDDTNDIYPFLDLPGVGVAFKLVQALQTRLDGLPDGQEKWLLDLVALGTVCDVVTLSDENRTHVYWGLRVLAKTRRFGLRALMGVAGIEPEKVNARDIGFGLGPRMNASGRLETAQYSLDMLLARDQKEALEAAERLDEMNVARRQEQGGIFKEATLQAQHMNDNVLVVSGKGWNHGIIGIVAAKLLEKYKKPTYVLEETESGEAKGSARSYGDFSVADAIRFSDDIITKGGGHALAAGVTLPVTSIDDFRTRVNAFYDKQGYDHTEQCALLLPTADVEATLDEITEDVIIEIMQMEPFGSGNTQPIITTKNLTIQGVRVMGADGQHVKLTLGDENTSMQFLAFNAPKEFFCEVGQKVDIWYEPSINEWKGRRSVEGRLLHLLSCQ